jgi:hypothetical protein
MLQSLFQQTSHGKSIGRSSDTGLQRIKFYKETTKSIKVSLFSWVPGKRFDLGLKTVTEKPGWFDAMAELAPDVTKQHQRSNFALSPSLDSSFTARQRSERYL